jgi:hypothetical protein
MLAYRADRRVRETHTECFQGILNCVKVLGEQFGLCDAIGSICCTIDAICDACRVDHGDEMCLDCATKSSSLSIWSRRVVG